MENMQVPVKVNLHDPELAAELEPEVKKIENEDGIAAESSKRRREEEGPTGSCSDPSALSQSTESQGSAPKSSKTSTRPYETTEPNVIFDDVNVDFGVAHAYKRPSFARGPPDERSRPQCESCDLEKKLLESIRWFAESPSFARGPPDERSRPQVQLVRNVFKVRLRASAVQTNPEVDEEIAEEDAVCKFCFGAFGEEDIFKTKCGCTNAFAHENCAANWSRERGNNCGYCEQENQNLPATLIRGQSSAQGVGGQGND